MKTVFLIQNKSSMMSSKFHLSRCVIFLLVVGLFLFPYGSHARDAVGNSPSEATGVTSAGTKNAAPAVDDKSLQDNDEGAYVDEDEGLLQTRSFTGPLFGVTGGYGNLNTVAGKAGSGALYRVEFAYGIEDDELLPNWLLIPEFSMDFGSSFTANVIEGSDAPHSSLEVNPDLQATVSSKTTWKFNRSTAISLSIGRRLTMIPLLGKDYMIYAKLGLNNGNFTISNAFIYDSPNKPNDNVKSDSERISMSSSGPSFGLGIAKELSPFATRGILSNLPFFWRFEYRRIFWDRANNFKRKYKSGDKSIYLQQATANENTYDVSTSFLPTHSDNFTFSIGIRF